MRLLLLLLLAGLCAAQFLPGNSPAPVRAPLDDDPELRIELRPHAIIRARSRAAAEAVAEEVGASLVRALAVPGHYVAEMHPDMPAHPDVLYVTHGDLATTRQVGVRPPVPIRFHNRGDAYDPEWPLNMTNARAAWALSNGTGATIVQPDTGADWTHPDLAAVAGALATDPVHPGASGMPPPSESHGTAAASMAVAAANGVCGTGIAPGATLIPVRLLQVRTHLTTTVKAEALLYAPAGHVAVVSNSWGPSDMVPDVNKLDSVMISTFYELTARNTCIVFAAGNGYDSGDHMALDGGASDRNTIAVGAVGPSGRVAPYSEAGAVAVAGPSSDDFVGVTAALPGDGCTNLYGGTSAAAPVIAAIIALLRPAPGAPPLTPADVLDVLVHAAAANPRGLSRNELTVRNDAGLYYSTRAGFGVPDALVAVQLAANRTARWVPANVQAPLIVDHPNVARGGTVFDAHVAANGTVTWAAATLGLEFGDCALSHVTSIVLESPAGTMVQVFHATRTWGVASLPELEFPTRGFHGEAAAGTWRVHLQHRCAFGILFTAVSRVEVQVV